jgi:beta-lactamase class A
VVSSCAPPPAPAASAGVRIERNTPQGVRAKQVMDMLNSDWPIGTFSVKTLAAPDMVDHVTATMDPLWYDRPYMLTGVDIGAGWANLHVISSFGAQQDIELRTNDQTMVSRLTVDTHKPVINSWTDVDAALNRTNARYSWMASKVKGGECEKVAGTNTDGSLPLASIFKTYVLFAVQEAVRAGRVHWDDTVTITSEAKKLGSSGFDKLPAGSRITVRQAAGKMIATSDNMATDLLIGLVGTKAVERALADAGHHDPASMTPFPTMREIFAIGWGNPDVREQWKSAPPADRAILLQQADSRPYEPDPERTRSPGSAYGAEWYGTAEDICRVHARLQYNATGAAAPVRDIMSEVSGIDIDRDEWPYIGAKAGNLPGDLTFSWYAEDRTGQAWVVSFQLNWPRFHSPNAGGWIMTIIKQVFGMLPRYR